MKKTTVKLTSAILIIIALAIMPKTVNAAEKIEGIILEKADNEKIIYIKGMEEKEFKYAFSNEKETSNANFITSSKDTNGEYVAFIEGEETYKYMFIASGENTEIIELSTMKSITENDIKEIENLTKTIKISTNQSNSQITKNGDTTVTETQGKIVIEDEGAYQFQSIEILDKNNSTAKLNETAVELYNKLQELQKVNKMYDKLLTEITIKEDYESLKENAKWENAENKEILQEQNSQDGEKFLVLIKEVKDEKTVRTDVQFMTCRRQDEADVEYTNTTETKIVEKKTELPVTGENLALYIVLAVVVVAIIILVVKMKSENGKHGKHNAK